MNKQRLTVEVDDATPGEARLAMEGDVDVAADEALAAAYTAAAARGVDRILLDFTRVDYINSTGIALIVRLLAEARRDRSADIAVPLPSSLSATALGRLRQDPETFARELARPMPRPPSPAARFGTRFHAWVEARFGQQDLFDYGDLPGRADAGIDDDTDLKELVATFETGPFATRVPHQVEAPFALVLAGQVVRGRIDAVYADGDGYLVVDWKTNRSATADPLQLALYRLAWAELHGIEPERVRAAFYYVRTGEVVEPEALPDRAALEEILAL